MLEATEIADAYMALWNETDPTCRRALLDAGWAADATYADPLMRGTGHQEIDALIVAVQAKFPEFRFALVRSADSVGAHVRFSWGLGPQGSAAVVEGTDFVHHDGSRIRSVTGFLDKVPAHP